MNKRFTLDRFEETVQLLRSHTVSILGYGFLKPPHLSEQEALDDAVKTIRYAVSHQIDRIMLEPAFVQEGTGMAAMFVNGEYTTPWLWTVLAVLRETFHLGQIGVGYPDDVPPPIFTATNCESCSPTFWSFFDQFNRTGAMASAVELCCSCELEWRRECAQPTESLEQRLARVVSNGWSN